MKILLSTHAKRRIYERNILMKNIKETINFPDYTVKRSDNEIEAYKKFNGKTLKVIYIETRKFIKIISVYYT